MIIMLPFIDLKAQQDRIRLQIEAAIKKVLDHGKYIMGPEVLELSEKLAKFVNAKHCITCSSGTDALLMGLMAYSVGPGDAILTTPFTFIATTEVINLVGATPIFVDINPETYTVDVDRIEEAIERINAEGKLKPRGIIPVDLFGSPAEYDAIMRIAEKHHVFVLQDAAQAFGAEYHGRKCPSLGHIGATSFFPAKPLGCYGDGGAVFTNDDQVAEIISSIRIHGQGSDKYDNVRVGLNARMDTLQAAILLEKLKLYPEEIQLRQQVAQAYFKYLKHKTLNTKLQRVPEGALSVYAQFCVEIDRRDMIQAKLREEGIPTVIYYPKPLHLMRAYAHLGYKVGDFPVSERVSQRILALPMHPYMKRQAVKFIVDTLYKCVGN